MVVLGGGVLQVASRVVVVGGGGSCGQFAQVAPSRCCLLQMSCQNVLAPV